MEYKLDGDVWFRRSQDKPRSQIIAFRKIVGREVPACIEIRKMGRKWFICYSWKEGNSERGCMVNIGRQAEAKAEAKRRLMVATAITDLGKLVSA